MFLDNTVFTILHVLNTYNWLGFMNAGNSKFPNKS